MPTRRATVKKAGPKYYPRRIALVAPHGDSVFEFVITGRDIPGMVAAITGVFGRHYVNLSSIDSDTIASGEFVFVVYCDFGKADASAAQVKKEIQALKFVTGVEFGGASDSLFERFLFPITVGGSNRAVILPVGALIGYEKAVMSRAGNKVGSRHLIDTGRPVGLGLAGTLRSYMPWAGADELVGAATGAMRALGWGLCKFDRSGAKGDAVSITIENPMFAGLAETSESWLLVGVASGILEGALKERYALEGEVVSGAASELKFRLARVKPAEKAKPKAAAKAAPKRR